MLRELFYSENLLPLALAVERFLQEGYSFHDRANINELALKTIVLKVLRDESPSSSAFDIKSENVVSSADKRKRADIVIFRRGGTGFTVIELKVVRPINCAPSDSLFPDAACAVVAAKRKAQVRTDLVKGVDARALVVEIPARRSRGASGGDMRPAPQTAAEFLHNALDQGVRYAQTIMGSRSLEQMPPWGNVFALAVVSEQTLWCQAWVPGSPSEYGTMTSHVLQQLSDCVA